MITCPKCQELNGIDRSTCWKCQTSLGSVGSLGAGSTYRKICPKCNIIYSQKTDICEKCYCALAVFSPSTPNNSDNDHSNFSASLHVIAVILPFIGIVLGCIYIGKNEDSLGRSLIITGIIHAIVYGVISNMIF